MICHAPFGKLILILIEYSIRLEIYFLCHIARYLIGYNFRFFSAWRKLIWVYKLCVTSVLQHWLVVRVNTSFGISNYQVRLLIRFQSAMGFLSSRSRIRLAIRQELIYEMPLTQLFLCLRSLRRCSTYQLSWSRFLC